jgi:hypothetical protein
LTLIAKASLTTTRRRSYISEKTRELIPREEKAWSRRRFSRIDESLVEAELRRRFHNHAERVVLLDRRLSQETN